MTDDQHKSSVNMDIVASVKAEVKTEIPKESSGRLVDALTDIIRPFSESRGLRADQIRLQREDVLIEITRKASERFAIEGGVPKPVPNKFMVPFLEKASCEDMESETLDLWSTLLVRASKAYIPSLVAFINMLGELGTSETTFLMDLAKKTDDDLTKDAPDIWRVMAQESNLNLPSHLISNLPLRSADDIREFRKKIEEIENDIGPRSILFFDVPMFYGVKDPDMASYGFRTPAAMDYGLSIDLLERQKLISRHTNLYPAPNRPNCDLKIEFICITALGLEFAKMCSPEINKDVQ